MDVVRTLGNTLDVRPPSLGHRPEGSRHAPRVHAACFGPFMSVPEITVRAATAADVPDIAAFAGELYTLHHQWDPLRFWDLGTRTADRQAGRERFFASLLSDPTVVLLVAESGGRRVGYAFAGFESHDYENLLEEAIWVHDLYVIPEARGGGAADQLMDAAARRGRDAGCPLLVLTVAEANTRAQAFFARHGARATMREMTLDLRAARAHGGDAGER